MNNKEFWILGIHPYPSAQNPKRKKKFENFLKQFRLLSEKRKGIHQLTTSIRLRLLSKSLHPNFSFAPPQKNFGYS
jgi:hypothetical protein